MNIVHTPTILSLTIGATLTLLDLWLFWRARSKPDRHLRLIRSDSQIRHVYRAEERAHIARWASRTGLTTWQQIALLGDVAYPDPSNPDPSTAA